MIGRKVCRPSCCRGCRHQDAQNYYQDAKTVLHLLSLVIMNPQYRMEARAGARTRCHASVFRRNVAHSGGRNCASRVSAKDAKQNGRTGASPNPLVESIWSFVPGGPTRARIASRSRPRFREDPRIQKVGAGGTATLPVTGPQGTLAIASRPGYILRFPPTLHLAPWNTSRFAARERIT